jgi:hypothetical protein
MASKSTPSVPLPRHVSDAFSHTGPLADLLRRQRQSEQRWRAAQQVLPRGLADATQPGPWDSTGWTLLTTSGAIAAKLRQCVPAIEAQLRAQGLETAAIVIKVSRPSSP